MNYTPWVLFTDVCIMGSLLLLGQILRAKVKLFQKFLIPASLIAGIIGLVLGPNGYGYIPFSGNLGTYAGILIVLAIVVAMLWIGKGLHWWDPSMKLKQYRENKEGSFESELS